MKEKQKNSIESSNTILEDDKTYDQYRAEYKRQLSALIRTRLQQMNVWFQETDRELKALIENQKNNNGVEQGFATPPDHD